MTGALVELDARGPSLAVRITPPMPLPLDRLVIGQPVDNALALLPRLFNLCGMAQGRAARLSLGRDPGPADGGAEVLRDHLAQLYQILPQAAGVAPSPLPHGDPLAALFGPGRTMPRDLPGLRDWAAGVGPARGLARLLMIRFARGEAAAPPLAMVPAGAGALLPGRYENSAAARQAGHPLLRAVAAEAGRGPLWRLLGLLADVAALVQGGLPPEQVAADGTATVAAARGTYALRLRAANGRITAVDRRTPTDHLLAPAGALDGALSRLPSAKAHLAPLVIALHDPCVPVTVREKAHA